MSDQKSFEDTAEAKFRREVRAMVKAGPFTKSERDVALAFVNHWLHHRRKHQVVHPGREKLAKIAKVSVPTVKRCLALLRDHGAIEATAHLHGLQGNATEYRVDVMRLTALCGKKKDDIRVNGGSNDPASGRVKMIHRLADVVNLQSHREKLAGGRNA
jgi:DNA-binding transcriptional MocR family regulator